MRRLLSFLLGATVLAGLLGIGDVLLRGYVERQVASAVVLVDPAGVPLPEPEVSIGGPLFVPQLVQGRFTEVTFVLRGVVLTSPAGTVTLGRVTAVLTGARLGVGDVLAGPLERVPADSVRAQALVPWSEVTRFAPAGTTVAAAGNGRVAVTATVDVGGQPVAVTAVATPSVQAGEIRLVAQELRGPDGPAGPELQDQLAGRLDVAVPLGALPYGLVPTAAVAGADGLLLEATATEIVLEPLPAPGPGSP